jgi:O-antigen/teichoic acid export membrane protein
MRQRSKPKFTLENQWVFMVIRVGAAVLQTFTFLYFTRLAPIVEVGLVASILGIMTIFITMLDFGSRNLAPIEYKKGNSQGVIGILNINWFSSFVILFASSIIVTLLILKAELYPEFLLITIWFTIEKTIETIMSLASVNSNPRHIFISTIFRRLIPAVCFILLSSFNSNPLLDLSASLLLGSFFGLPHSLLWLRSNRLLRKPTYRLLMGTIKFTKDISTQSFWNLAINTDVLLIGLFGGSFQTGLYAAAVRVSNPFYLINETFLSSFRPMISTSSDSIRRFWRKRFILVFLAFSIFSLVIVFSSEIIITLLFGDRYTSSAKYLELIFAFLPSILASYALQSFLIGLGDLNFLKNQSILFALTSLVFGTVGGLFFQGLGVVVGMQLPYVLRGCILLSRLNHLLERIDDRSQLQ